VTRTEQPTPRPPAVSQRRTVSRAGAPIRLERLTMSQAVREAIERQFRRDVVASVVPSSR
jgi:hypothetical protein